MTTTTQTRYRDRIEQGVRLLSERFADPPGAEALAREVGVSRYHFQRLYRAATGESVLETVNRLRAIRALELLEAGRSVGEIAEAVGYETPQAFARAFRAWTGLSPSQARGRAGEIKSRLARPAAESPAPVEVEIVSLDPVSLTVIHTRQPIGPLNAVYEALFGAVAHAGRMEDVRGIYGVPFNDPQSDPDQIADHMAALEIAGPRVAGLEQFDMAGGRAVRARHTGPFERLEETSLAVYAKVLARGWTLADHPARHHHLDDPENVPAGALRTDIYLLLEETS